MSRQGRSEVRAVHVQLSELQDSFGGLHVSWLFAA